MKIYNIFFSPTGGTKKAACELVSAWEDVTEIDMIKSKDKIRAANFCGDDLVFIAVPSFGGRVPVIAADILKTVSGNKARAVLTAVYGNRAYDDTLKELKDILENAGFVCIAAAAVNAEHSIMRQYGKNRPDEQDIAELREFSAKIKSAVENHMHTGSVNVPGNYPYCKYGGVPMSPRAGKDCTNCGICVSQCPAGAIPANKPSHTEKSKCISCMRCISVCPVQARSLNKMMVSAAALAMRKMLEQRKSNELFL